MDECRFCRIVAGECEAHVLYEDERSLAFLDANPATEGHVLVIPRAHGEDLLRQDWGTLSAVVTTAQAVATVLDDVLAPDGFSLFHTTGGLVGTVEHAHLHVVPRREDDDIRLALDRDDLDETVAEELARRLRSTLQ